MYTLYWNPRSSSQAPMALLEELDLAYRLHKVDMEGGECDTSEYRAIQPLGLVPALGLLDGRTLFESAAIVQFLADRHGIGSLAPAVDDPDRAPYLQWMHYLSGTLYPSYNRYFWPARYSASETDRNEIRDHIAQIVLPQWQVVEDALEVQGPWLLGERFCAADIYLQMVTTWHKQPAELLRTFPRIRDLAEGVLQRDACRRANQKHGFVTGFDHGT